MPVFHTKTIESILEPVSKQVGQLVILHEEGQDGNAIPNLDAPVSTVQAAVANLYKVGSETVEESTDLLLKRDMPPALDTVQAASDSLGQAAEFIRVDPYSVQGREVLIKGARGILQGTSDLLLAFDQGEVRKLVKQVRAVLDYIGLADQIQRMEDVVVFVKSLTPGITRVGRDVRERAEELTSQVHRDLLLGSLERATNATPQLVSSLKLFVNSSEGEKAQAAEQRHLSQTNMKDELKEVIRVLQLVHYDVHGWEPISVSELKRLKENFDDKMKQAKQWIADPNAPPGGEGEKRTREAAQVAQNLGKAAGAAGFELGQAATEFGAQTDKLAAARAAGQAPSEQREQMKTTLAAANKVESEAAKALSGAMKAADAYHKVRDNWQQAQHWLADSSAPVGEGSQAVRKVIDAGKEAALLLPQKEREELHAICCQAEDKLAKLEKLRAAGKGASPEAQALAIELRDDLEAISNRVNQCATKQSGDLPTQAELDRAKQLFTNPLKDDGSGVKAVRKIISDARQLASYVSGPVKEALLDNAASTEQTLDELEVAIRNKDENGAKNAASCLEPKVHALMGQMENASIAALASDFSDTSSALKQLSLAAYAPATQANRSQNFAQKVMNFTECSQRLAGLGRMAAPQLGTEREIIEAQKLARRIDEISPALVQAGRIVLNEPDNKPAKEHFELLKDEWSHSVDKLTATLDGAADGAKLIAALEAQMIDDQAEISGGVDANNVHGVLPAAGNMARRAHRVLMIAKREAENSEDPAYVNAVRDSFNVLNSKVQPMIGSAKTYAQKQDGQSGNQLVVSGRDLLDAVGLVRTAIEPVVEPEFPPPPEVPDAPQMPQVPPEPVDEAPEIPEAPEEFPSSDEEVDQDIYLPAKELFDEVNKWMTKGNSLIDAAKRMALLMAEMSRLVQEGGNKGELIRCAQEIVKYGQLVAKLSREIAAKCTDKRIKNNMSGSSQNIETISTQFRILSTVKATMLTEEERQREIDRALDIGDIDQDARDVSDDEAAQAHEMLVHNAQNLMRYVKEVVREANAANIKIRADSGLTIKWVPKDQQQQRKRKQRRN